MKPNSKIAVILVVTLVLLEVSQSETYNVYANNTHIQVTLTTGSNLSNCTVNRETRTVYINNPPYGSVNRTSFVLSSSRLQQCSWHISTPNRTLTVIKILEHGSLIGTDHLYIEREINSSDCNNAIVVFHKSNLSCPFHISENRFKIHIKGDIMIEIQESDENISLDCSLKSEWSEELSAVSTTCNTFESYDDVIMCTFHSVDFKYNYLSDWQYYTRCETNCPANCNCSLGKRKIIYHCISNDTKSYTTKSYLTFPTNISHLNFSHNNIEMLSFDAFEGFGNEVLKLDLGTNNLQIINFLQYLPNLEELGVTRNTLTSVESDEFSNLKNLTELWLYQNNLVKLNLDVFKGLVKLNKLIMWGCNLSEIQPGLFDSFTLLQVLEVGINPLTSLEPGIFKYMKNLLYMGLRLCHLYELKAYTFLGLQSLQNLYLNQNNLLSIEDGAFDGLFQLRSLVLSENQLKSLPTNLFKDLGSLVELDLSFNHLTAVPGLRYLLRMEYLDLKGNSLANVQQSMFTDVRNSTKVTVDQPEVCACYLSHVTECAARQKRSEYLTCERLLSAPALAIFTWIFGFAAILGNVMVLLRRNLCKKGVTNVAGLLLTNLALSDFIMGVYMIMIASADVHFGNYFPLQAEKWRTGVFCRVASTLAITSSEASVIFLTLISIDRFICIKYPFTSHKLRPKGTRYLAVFIWFISIVLGAVPSVLAGRDSTFYDNSHVCIGLPLTKGVLHGVEQKSVDSFYGDEVWYTNRINITTIEGYRTNLYYSIFLFFGFNFFCFFVILFCYEEILRTAYLVSKAAGKKREMKEQLRLCAKAAVIVATDFFCWFPVIIIGILGQTGIVTVAPKVFAWVVTFILPINSAINPYLYTLAEVILTHLKALNHDAKSRGGTTRLHVLNSNSSIIDKSEMCVTGLVT